MNSALDHTREFPFSAEHFRVITDRIYRFSGIKLPEAKREMVYARLARRLRSLGLASFDDYVRYLEAEPSEWEHCTNALTTNVTSFFREEHHFRVLAEHAQARAGKAGAYRVWSAGCSTVGPSVSAASWRMRAVICRVVPVAPTKLFSASAALRSVTPVVASS